MSESPFQYDQAALDAAPALTVFIPGALSPISIFSSATAVFSPYSALAFYRLPGLDGLPSHPPLDIVSAGREVAEFVSRFPEKKVAIVGYSTGAAIAIEASHHCAENTNIRIALLSPVPEKAGGFETLVKGLLDIAIAAAAVRSVRLAVVWPEYWKILLFGRRAYLSGAKRMETARLLEIERANIVHPSSHLRKAHVESLGKWRMSSSGSKLKHETAAFIGLVDPVFSLSQFMTLLQKAGVSKVRKYAGHGHLLFLSEHEVFSEIFDFCFPPQ